jgi:hypothetical protein
VRELGREEMHVNVGGAGKEEMAMDGHRAPILKLDRKRRGIYIDRSVGELQRRCPLNCPIY